MSFSSPCEQSKRMPSRGLTQPSIVADLNELVADAPMARQSSWSLGVVDVIFLDAVLLVEPELLRLIFPARLPGERISKTTCGAMPSSSHCLYEPR